MTHSMRFRYPTLNQ
ncbi:erythromycin resistance leader peptide [Niallia sp. Sow4_A1]